MKRIISIILVMTLILSMFILFGSTVSAEAITGKPSIVPVSYYEYESCPPEETEPPYEEPSCEPVWETEPERETTAPSEPSTDFPTEPNPMYETGSCGENAYYSFDVETGELKIYGSGYVTVHRSWDGDDTEYPWRRFIDKIVSLTVEGVDNVPDHSFENCPNLECVVIGDTVTSLGSGEYDYDREWWERYYPPYTFHGCEKLKTVTLGNGITYLNGGEFRDCTALENVDLPNGLTDIGQSSFSGCVNLTDIDFPDTLTSIGDYAFSGCECVKPQRFSHISSIGNYAFSNCTAIETAEFDTKVNRIGNNAFENCTALRRVAFADGADSLGSFIFSGCTLAEFSFSGELGSANNQSFAGAAFYDDAWHDDVLVIGDILIKAKVSISGTCTVPDGVKMIFHSAFEGCDHLEAVILPDSVTTIGMYAFQNCYSLESLKLGSGLTEIGFKAFNGCSVLNQVNVPNIGEWLDLSIQYTAWFGPGSGGHSETSYTANPFYYRANLTINGEPIENLVIDNRQTINGYLFYNCGSIKTVTVEGDVSIISRNAFFGCTGLQEVTLGKNVQQVGIQAFWNCAKLKKITFLNPDCQIANAYEAISGSAVIFGYDDSTAQMYAGNYNRSFVLLENTSAICGDADGDGEITVMDVTEVQHHLSEMNTKVDNTTLTAADVDKNGILEIIDATWILRHLAGMGIPYTIGQ